MIIKLKPTCIIERGLWHKYVSYCLPKDTNIENYLTKNEEFEISEEDALVIGLVKCITTNNLVHRCNTYILDLMSIKTTELSINDSHHFMIGKKLLIDSIELYKKNFPAHWKPDAHYKKGLDELNEYLAYLIEKIETLEVYKFQDKEYVYCNHIKKTLKLYNN